MAGIDSISALATVLTDGNMPDQSADGTKQSSILVADRLFKDESKGKQVAETAVSYGYTVVVSTSFAENFKTAALNRHLLPIRVTNEFMALIHSLSKSADVTLNIDLPNQEIRIENTPTWEYFSIDPLAKFKIMNGLQTVEANQGAEYDIFTLIDGGAEPNLLMG